MNLLGTTTNRFVLSNSTSLAPSASHFGRHLLELIPERLLEDWKKDPVISYGAHVAVHSCSLFDLIENADADWCLFLLQMVLHDGRNSDYKTAKLNHEKLTRERAGYRPLEKAVDDLYALMVKRAERGGGGGGVGGAERGRVEGEYSTSAGGGTTTSASEVEGGVVMVEVVAGP